MGNAEFRALVIEWLKAREHALMLGNRWPDFRGRRRMQALNEAYDAKRIASDLEEQVREELGLYEEEGCTPSTAG